MKKRVLTILAFFIVFSGLSPILVNALSQDEINLSYSWSKQTYYQGDTGSVTISLTSTCGDELKFTWIGIHFQWQLTDYYYRLDLSDDSISISIPPGGSYHFPAISFSIPTDASAGYNYYHVKIYMEEQHWYGWTTESWQSPTNLINIIDSYLEIYSDTKSTIDNKINQATYSNYQSSDAKTLLQQAKNERDLAALLAGQGKWSDAVIHLQMASNFVEQAIGAEDEYWKDLASNAISGAQSEISKVVNLESLDAKNLLSQANSKLSEAQYSYNFDNYKEAYEKALSATTSASEARTAETNYQNQKQQQMLLLGGVGGLVVIIIIAVIVTKNRSKRKSESAKAVT